VTTWRRSSRSSVVGGLDEAVDHINQYGSSPQRSGRTTDTLLPGGFAKGWTRRWFT